MNPHATEVAKSGRPRADRHESRASALPELMVTCPDTTVAYPVVSDDRNGLVSMFAAPSAFARIAAELLRGGIGFGCLRVRVEPGFGKLAGVSDLGLSHLGREAFHARLTILVALGEREL